MTSNIKFPDPVFKLGQTVTEPSQFSKLYFKRYKCTIYTAVIFEFGAASLEILFPWLISLYFFHPTISEEYKQKKFVKNLTFFLLFVISFCSWVKGYTITRATENMAKEMRYDIFHNYIMGLEKDKIMKRINYKLGSAFHKKEVGLDLLTEKEEIMTFAKTDEFSITEVDEHVGNIMADLKKTAS